MKEQSIIEVGESRPGWEALEAYAREGVRRWLQHLLEEEVGDPWVGGGMRGGTAWTPRRATGRRAARHGG